MIRRLQFLGLAFLVLALTLNGSSASTHAAAPQAAGSVTITGSIVDADLKPLANAVVTLERGGQVVARTTSLSDGTFTFSNVAPGDYQVHAELTGHAALRRDLHVAAGATSLKLPLAFDASGGPATSVDVKADTAILQSASGERSDVVQQQQLESLPVANRGFRDLVNLLPGVAATPPPAPIPAGGGGGGRGGAAAARVGGGGQDNIMIDGISVLDTGNNGLMRPPYWAPPSPYGPPQSAESYAPIYRNRFHRTAGEPLSTFGADVDTAAYTNVRRFLSAGQLPPPDAVRVEELVNFFKFDYADPRGGAPLALTTEMGDCPWAPTHKLVLVGARARSSTHESEGRNITLLIDVSGSMQPADRLPLIKSALALFVDTLHPDDRIAIVTYAGTSGIALPSTPARNRDLIQRAIAGLYADGSTNGGAGLITAYRVARQNFIPGGINRVILATDGDFNVGIVNQADLVRLIQREKDSGVFLSVFGVGRGNLKDSTMEMLADKGNGHYAYLDSLQEAERVLVREGDGTLETVAKDVKFQVEFNPSIVGAWKLLGYEDRALAARDLNDDRKDGGEMGAAHTVTVLYEVVPVAAMDAGTDAASRPYVDPLRYQDVAPAPRPAPTPAMHTDEWMTVKARYQLPEGTTSTLITQVVRAGNRAPHLALASAVAEFGLLLRDEPRDAARWDGLMQRVQTLQPAASQTADVQSFGELVRLARGLARIN